MRREKSFKSNSSYVFKRKIGSGGLADVYLFLRKTRGYPDQEVALKVLKETSSESIQELINEGEKLKKLKHPCILNILGYENLNSQTHAIVLEYIDGTNLKALHPYFNLPERKSFAAQIGQQLYEALCEAHESGVIHGDISARNILVSAQGDIKLSDFGLARHDGEIMVSPNKGSLDYLSPERWLGGGPSKGADLFALGILIYEVLTGVNPLAAPTAEEIKLNLENFLKEHSWGKFESPWQKCFDFLFLQKPCEFNLKSYFAPNFKTKLAHHVVRAKSQSGFLSQTMTILIKKTQTTAFLSFQRAMGAFLFLFAAVNPVAVGNDVVFGAYKRPCVLTVTSQPWGEVFIDGASQGYTPLINMPIAAGYHHFLWRNYHGREVKKTLMAFNNGILFLQILAEPNKPKL